jgi:hypothetical protein
MMGNELTASFNWTDNQLAYLGVFQEMISRLPLRNSFSRLTARPRAAKTSWFALISAELTR